jgi:hypothetical protein
MATANAEDADDAEDGKAHDSDGQCETRHLRLWRELQSMQSWHHRGCVIGCLLAACSPLACHFAKHSKPHKRPPIHSSSSTPGFCICDPAVHCMSKDLCINYWQVADTIAWGSRDDQIFTWLNTSNKQEGAQYEVRIYCVRIRAAHDSGLATTIRDAFECQSSEN